MHDKLFWRRDFAAQTEEAMNETRKRYSIYSLIPPKVRDPEVEAEATPEIVEEAKSDEAASTAAKEEFKGEPAAERKEPERTLEYPECSVYGGMAKVRCLIGSILKDKSLDRQGKIHRLQGVSLHNRRNHWAAQDEVDRRVARAREYVEASE